VGIDWGPLEVLADPTRRDLYDHVRRSGSEVTREEAAAAIGISRGLAAFHLDKLVDAGLLMAGYQAPEPRGRGRAPKVYRAAGVEIGLSVPGRRYDLMGEILAEAIAGEPTDARAAALVAAYQRGHAEGEAERAGGGRLEGLLERLGFEPDDVPANDAAASDAPEATASETGAPETTASETGAPETGAPETRAPANAAAETRAPADAAERADDVVRLRNCPFHRLAARHTELVCGLNEAFISGILHGIGSTALTARLAPAPGFCCVRLAAAP
jgi:predicted ArsR family transcriptional regulator